VLVPSSHKTNAIYELTVSRIAAQRFVPRIEVQIDNSAGPCLVRSLEELVSFSIVVRDENASKPPPALLAIRIDRVPVAF
jgi:hypothetical protein